MSAGALIFVAAGREHRFYDITEELVVLVFCLAKAISNSTG